MSRAAKVLGGMSGTVWIEKEHFHCIRAELNVMEPVPIYGVLARVLPGTRVEFAMAPVTESIWLVTNLAMNLNVAKLWFKSSQISNSTYSNFRLNSAELEELLATAD